MIIHHCCGRRIDIKRKESRGSQRICLILLMVFTCALATGCILLSAAQDVFHREAVDTLNYVVNQSDYTVQTLVNQAICNWQKPLVWPRFFFLQL
ncbi:putative transmembrane protein [Helianthus debilis subsp. tardiflorus]